MWVIADGYRNAIYNFNDVQAITIGRTYGEDGEDMWSVKITFDLTNGLPINIATYSTAKMANESFRGLTNALIEGEPIYFMQKETEKRGSDGIH